MSIRVYVSGNIVEPEAAKISVFDRGFLFGDSVYETVGTVGGRLFALGDHLDRLAQSADRIGLDLPARDVVEKAVRDTLAAAGNPESRVRIMVTRGVGRSGDLDPRSAQHPELIVIVQPLNPPARELYERGVGVEVVSITRNHPGSLDPAVKSGNYLNNVLALGQARSRRADVHEAILCSPDGFIAEGATSNVFAVKGGVLLTPALSVGILSGITRGKVLALAREAGVPCVETRFSADDFRAAEEAFITSAARGILPVTRIDGQAVGDGNVGTITRQLMSAYQQMLDRQVAEEADHVSASSAAPRA